MTFDLLTNYTNGHFIDIIFYIIAFISFPMAIGVIMDKVIIRSGFMLIGLFGTICAMFLLLQAQFIALAQLMIYAVGITLVVVIALMLTSPKLESLNELDFDDSKISGFFLSLAVFFTLFTAIKSESWPVRPEISGIDSVKVIGAQLMTGYSIPFEFASLLLLSALIGAIMIAKHNQSVTKKSPVQTNEDNLITSSKK